MTIYLRNSHYSVLGKNSEYTRLMQSSGIPDIDHLFMDLYSRGRKVNFIRMILLKLQLSLLKRLLFFHMLVKLAQ